MAIWLSSGWSHLCRNDVYVFQALLIKQKQKQKQNPVIHTRSHSTACRKKFYPGPVARSCHGAFVHAAHHGFCDYWLCWTQQITTPLVLHMEKAMAPHSSTLAWKIPWTKEPGRLQSMGSLRVGHDWVTSLSLLTFMRWRRKWQPTPVFLPGESQGRGSLVSCRLWGRTKSDTTEAT